MSNPLTPDGVKEVESKRGAEALTPAVRADSIVNYCGGCRFHGKLLCADSIVNFYGGAPIPW